MKPRLPFGIGIGHSTNAPVLPKGKQHDPFRIAFRSSVLCDGVFCSRHFRAISPYDGVLNVKRR